MHDAWPLQLRAAPMGPFRAAIFAAAGHPFVVFGISYKKLCEITNGKIVNITI